MNSTSKRNIGIATLVVVVIIAAGVVFGPGLAKSFAPSCPAIPQSVIANYSSGQYSTGYQNNGCSALPGITVQDISYYMGFVSPIGSFTASNPIYIASAANYTAYANQLNALTVKNATSIVQGAQATLSQDQQNGANSYTLQALNRQIQAWQGISAAANASIAYNNALKNTAIQQQTGATPPTLKIGTYNCTGGCATTIVYNQSNLLNTGLGVVAVAQPLSDLVNVTVNGRLWFSGVQGMQGIGTDYLPQNFGMYTFVATDQATGSTSSATVVFNPSPATTTVNVNPGGPIQPTQPQQPQQPQTTTKQNVGFLQGIWDWILKALNQEV